MALTIERPAARSFLLRPGPCDRDILSNS